MTLQGKVHFLLYETIPAERADSQELQKNISIINTTKTASKDQEGYFFLLTFSQAVHAEHS